MPACLHANRECPNTSSHRLPQQADQAQPAGSEAETAGYAADLAAQLEEARREAAAAHAQAAAARSRGALVERAWQSAVEVRRLAAGPAWLGMWMRLIPCVAAAGWLPVHACKLLGLSAPWLASLCAGLDAFRPCGYASDPPCRLAAAIHPTEREAAAVGAAGAQGGAARACAVSAPGVGAGCSAGRRSAGGGDCAGGQQGGRLTAQPQRCAGAGVDHGCGGERGAVDCRGLRVACWAGCSGRGPQSALVDRGHGCR